MPGRDLWSNQPVIYEINTAVWLNELSRKVKRQVTLADVAPADWDDVTPAGIDAVWLMGVWERSPLGLAVANGNEALQASFRQALPDVGAHDIMGSPYCVRRYVVDERFGGPDGLALARTALANRGVRLLLDYVPNHVAPDHPWAGEHPERFVLGDQHDLEKDPSAWIAVGEHVLARGRDPYFPPWPDVVQLNAFSLELRQATARTLAEISDQCDGIRCDMAMLMMNDIFSRTWGDRAGSAPPDDFWPTVIGDLRARHPQTRLLAEAYWDLEWELQQQGFDFCYDKRLYDRILERDPAPLRSHLGADVIFQSRLVRFLENHDEPRVAERLDPDVERAAAVMVATLPGATMWHEGQFEGRRVRPPVFLSRRPDEPLDFELAAWYRTLISTVAGSGMRRGRWQLVDVKGWPDNQTCANLLAWAWAGERGVDHVVAVNFSGTSAQGRVPLGWANADWHTRPVQFTDLLDQASFERDGQELLDPGLFVALEPWRYHVLSLR
jgi:Alpha amylase, catalytic domain